MTSITASNTYPSASPAKADASSGSARSDELLEEFTKWAHMTKAEQIRAKYLEQHDMSEADLKHMNESERQSVEDEIAQLVSHAFKMPGEATGPSDQSTSLLNLRLSAMVFENA